jgi:hypothetical protein
MKIKRWNDFLSYIKESKEETEEEFNPWMLDEEDIRDYFQESIDAGYQIEVRYGFVGQERQWDYKENKAHYLERFTNKMVSGSIQPAISILITSENVSSNDVSDNLKFAYSIIAEEADADISILDSDGEIGDIDGIIAKDGLFFTETWNKVKDEEPTITEVEGYIEFLVKKKESINTTPLQLAKYYRWGSYEEKDGNLYVDYSLEDLADEMLARDANYKDILINGDDGSFHDNYWNGDYQPDLSSLFEYHLDKENKVLAVKALIKEAGGLEQFVSHIGDECDDMIYDAVKGMSEEELIEYLLKERQYKTLKQMSKSTDTIGELRQSYGDWAMNAHADTNLQEIKDEFDSILDKNFKYIKGTREVEKKSKHKDENGIARTYTDEETFYLIRFSNDWIEEIGADDLENEKLTNIFETYLDTNELNRLDLKPYFSDYGNVDDKAWNRDEKSYLLRFLGK